MRLGLVGRKVGMTRIFTKDGQAIPVTVLCLANNRIAQLKTQACDGYVAVQLAFGERKHSRVTSSLKGHFAKAGIEPASLLKEFRISAEQAAGLTLGAPILLGDVFQVGSVVNVQGYSKGKGFAGTIKRYNFNSGRASHGNSRSHNVPGSIGMAQDPGRVFPGKRMCGQMGNVHVTVRNLEVVQIDTELHLLFIKGAVPGAEKGVVFVEPAANVNNRSEEVK